MNQKKNPLSRRAYMKTLGAGALGGTCLGMAAGCSGNTAAPVPAAVAKDPLKRKEEPATVSLAKGDDRKEIVYRSMMNLKEDIVRAIGSKKVLVKPNMVVAGNPGCATHPDAVRAVLDFLREHTHAEVVVGESTADRDTSTMECFEQYGYFPLRDEYGVELIDLNKEPHETRFILGPDNTSVPVRVISALMDPELFLISVPRMKVHLHAYVTLSLKNVLMAAPKNDYAEPEKGWANGDKYAMHITKESPPTDPLFYNLYLMSHHVYPDLAVIDGYEGMTEHGPIGGPLVISQVAVTSLDALAADVTGTRVMGLDPTIVPLFNFMKEAGIGQGDPAKINVTGTPLADCIYQYKPARSMEQTASVDVQGLFEPMRKSHVHKA